MYKTEQPEMEAFGDSKNNYLLSRIVSMLKEESSHPYYDACAVASYFSPWRKMKTNGDVLRWFGKSLTDDFHFPYITGLEHNHFFDHCTIVKVDGEKMVLNQPYNPLNMKDLETLILFCKKNQLTFSISPSSAHFVGHTLGILFKKTTEEEKPSIKTETKYENLPQLPTGNISEIRDKLYEQATTVK